MFGDDSEEYTVSAKKQYKIPRRVLLEKLGLDDVTVKKIFYNWSTNNLEVEVVENG